MDLLLWGYKTHAFFDWWSLEHFFSGMSVGAMVYLYVNKVLLERVKLSRKDNIKVQFIILLALNFIWETLEHYLEVGVAGKAVEYWFFGVEHIANRMISDPLMVFLGWIFIMWYYKDVKKYDMDSKSYFLIFVRIFTMSWLIGHIFFLEHSMMLHEILF